ncbi:MAG: GNAT family N-acetyltransferase [Rhodothermales bacterium]
MFMVVRNVETKDRDAWLRMRYDLWPNDQAGHAGAIARFFSGGVFGIDAVLVAEDRGELKGFVELYIRPCAEGCISERVAYLEGWYVVPEARRRGVGRALIAAAEQWAKEQGCQEFASDAAPENVMSMEAHLACGFEEVGLVRCFRKGLPAGEG